MAEHVTVSGYERSLRIDFRNGVERKFAVKPFDVVHADDEAPGAAERGGNGRVVSCGRMVKSHTTLAPMAGLSHVALPNRATAQMARGTSADHALDQARAVWAGPPRGLREIITHLVTNWI